MKTLAIMIGTQLNDIMRQQQGKITLLRYDIPAYAAKLDAHAPQARAFRFVSLQGAPLDINIIQVLDDIHMALIEEQLLVMGEVLIAAI